MEPLRVTVTGGHGRLGRLLVPWLQSLGADVYAPPRTEVDWTDPSQAYRACHGADRVVALASWTDVVGAQEDPSSCVRDTVITTQTTMEAADPSSIRWVGTDYTLALDRGGTGVGWYTAAKSIAEQLVLHHGGAVARVAFVTPEQVRRWSWVDGLSRSSRCWVDQLVPRLAAWVLSDRPPPLVHLGGDHPTTLDELLRTRMPDHPALRDVVTDPEVLAERGGGTRPPDTSWPEYVGTGLTG